MKHLLDPTHPSVTNQRPGCVGPNRQKDTWRETSRVELTDSLGAGSDGGGEGATDRVTECPGLVLYVPGKYLRISPHTDDTDLWPDAVRSHRCDGTSRSLLSGTRWGADKDASLSVNACRRPWSLPSCKYQSSILVAMCLIVAIIGLAGLTRLM